MFLQFFNVNSVFLKILQLRRQTEPALDRKGQFGCFRTGISPPYSFLYFHKLIRYFFVSIIRIVVERFLSPEWSNPPRSVG